MRRRNMVAPIASREVSKFGGRGVGGGLGGKGYDGGAGGGAGGTGGGGGNARVPQSSQSVPSLQ